MSYTGRVAMNLAREMRLLANRGLGKIEPQRRRTELRPVVSAFDELEVLEIGGPSVIFEPALLLPVYGVIAHRDLANYASSTLWDSGRRSSPARREFVAEATALGCPDEAYDGLLASHVIEHTANPLGALAEWRRVTREDGPLLIVVPHREMTFDHRRTVTTLEHMRDDERAAMGEDDQTHVPEVLARHDPQHDFFEGDAEAFERRCRDNLRFRALHHHVFSTRSAALTVHAAGLVVTHIVACRPHHIVILARRPGTGEVAPVTQEALQAALRRSPFASDRRDV